MVLISYAIFDIAREKQRLSQEKLERVQEERVMELAFEKGQHRELLEEIASQEDPAWIERVLIRRLGVVPEGQTKVVFH